MKPLGSQRLPFFVKQKPFPTMKRLQTLLSVIAILLLAACATTNDGLTKAERRALTAKKVESLLATRRYTVEMDYMQPLRGSMRRIDYGYEVTIAGDTLKSYLPYFGRAYNIPYGGGKGLNFTALITAYQEQRVGANRSRVVVFTENEEDNYQYVFDIYDNGKADLEVFSRERDRISYMGSLKLND